MTQRLRHRYVRLLRLDKPTGIWLLMWPCWWSAALAAHGVIPYRELALFFLGAVLMRSAGCVINDLTDRDIDRAVARTKTRPLASGEVSAREACGVLFLLLAASLLVAMALGWKIVLLGLCWLPLVVAYPWMKRITFWPQAFLGVTFNAGALFGWVAVRGVIEWPAVLLFAGAFFWTLGYDTLYAHQDKEDDAAIGVGSTARLLGERTKPYVALFYIVFLLSLAGAGALAGASPAYGVFCLLAAIPLLAQPMLVNLSEPESCLRLFKCNEWVGLIIFFAMITVA